MATGRVLPPEVVEHILDKLATSEVSDLRTLATCSLVCRTWLPRSSAHFLKSISVPAQDLERYLAFAKTSARLATHVREFTLTGSVNVIRYFDAMFAIMPKLNHLELSNNLTPFERLEIPAYHTANPMSPNPTQRSPHADNISSVAPNDCFTLSYLKMDHVQPASLVALLRSFNQIETLEFRGVVGEAEYQDLNDSHVLFNHIKNFCTEQFPHLLPVTAIVKNMVFSGNSAMAGMIAFLSMRPVTITLKDVLPPNLRHTLGFLNDVGRDVEHVKLLPAKITAGPGRTQMNWDGAFHSYDCHVYKRGADIFDLVTDVMRVRDGVCPKLQTLELSIENIEVCVRSSCGRHCYIHTHFSGFSSVPLASLIFGVNYLRQCDGCVLFSAWTSCRWSLTQFA